MKKSAMEEGAPLAVTSTSVSEISPFTARPRRFVCNTRVQPRPFTFKFLTLLETPKQDSLQQLTKQKPDSPTTHRLTYRTDAAARFKALWHVCDVKPVRPFRYHIQPGPVTWTKFRHPRQQQCNEAQSA